MTLFAPDLLRNFALGFGAGALFLGMAGLAQDPSSPTSTTQASLTPAPPSSAPLASAQSGAIDIGQSRSENGQTNGLKAALPSALDPGVDTLLAPLEINR
ncbi:MAG: hypothetical protein AAFY07_10985 [Pseudomonadota bacterium]